MAPPETDLRPRLRLWDRVSYPLWINFESAVRAGEGQRQFNRFSEEEQQIFYAGVEAFSVGAALALAEGMSLAAIAACWM